MKVAEIHNEFMDVSVVSGVLNASIDGISINANSQTATLTNSNYTTVINENIACKYKKI